jgi:hypothetical protein
LPTRSAKAIEAFNDMITEFRLAEEVGTPISS